MAITLDGTTGITASGNVTGGNIITAGSIAATGNISGDNINITGALTPATITATGTITGGNLTTGGNLSVTGTSSHAGNATFGNISATGLATVTGNITGGNLSGTNIVGTLTTASQTNITTVGTLGLLAVTGNVTGGNVTTAGTANIGTLAVTGTASVTGNITGGNLSGTNIVGTLTTASQTNITSVGTLGTLAVTGNITSGNLSGNNIVGTLTTASQTNITSVGTLGSLAVTGNVTGGNLTTVGTANVGTLAVTGTASVTGNANVGNIGAVRGVFTGNINMGSQYINSVSDPVQNQDVATKSYVDQQISTGIAYHQPVAAATTTTVAVATSGVVTYNNGTAGVGATLSTTGTFLNIDSANVQTVGTRILVKNEANAAHNGIYTYANTTAIVRSLDADTYGPDSTTDLSINDYFFTEGGVVNEGVAFVVSAPTGTITFGTSNITFATFSTSQVYDAGTGLTLTGTSFSVDASQTQITSVGTLGSLAVTGNITSGNLSGTSIVGTLTTASQTNITAVGTLGSLAVTGNISGGNLSVTDIAGTLSTASQPSITSVGTLTSLAVTGNITSGNLSGTSIVGTLTTAAQTNITSVGTLDSLAVTGNISGGNISTAGNLAAPTAAQNTNTTQVATTAFVLAQVSSTTPTTIGTNTIGTGTTFARADHTHTGVASLANGGGITASASTGAVTLGSTATNANTASAIVARDASGNFSAGTITAALTGAATTAGTVTTAAQGNITSVGTLTGLTVSGLIQPNANATIDFGATAARFNNVYGVTFIGISNQAKYADLAENYVADAEYAPGTVVSFGGSEEITQSTVDSDSAVAGVVSENPAYLMNSHQEGTHVIALALQGRVLCNVTGFINKGDLLVSAGNGRARTEKTPSVGTVIGKALQNHAGGEGTIEVVVGIR